MPSTSTGQAVKITRNVVLSGYRPIMFDRYSGDNKTALEVSAKAYISENGQLVLPTENVYSFLTAVNTTSAPKRLLDKREYKEVCSAFQSFVTIDPMDEIPFLKNGEPIFVGKFENDVDAKSGMKVMRHVARLKDGIPNPKVRPMLPLPWELAFKITLMKNSEVNEALLQRMFTDGGVVVGFGTFRGRYGKFEVTRWE